MKKVNSYIITRLLLLAGFCLCHTITRAQDTLQTTKDSSVIKMAAALSISSKNAEKIQDAYNYHRAEIDRVMKDRTMKPKEQMQRLRQLVAERRQILNTEVAVSNQVQLRNKGLVILQARSDAIKERHAEQVNRMPHKQLSTGTQIVNKQ